MCFDQQASYCANHVILLLCRWKQPRSNWVYSSSTAAADAAQPSLSTLQAGLEADSAGSSGQEAMQQQQQVQPGSAPTSPPAEQQQQQPDSSGQLPGSPSTSQQESLQDELGQHASPQHQQQQQHSSQEDSGEVEQPPQSGPHQQPQQPQAQAQEQPQSPQQPPVVEFGPYYSRTPVRQYHGHCEDILDVSWSTTGGFLLSASLDKTVRLWHLTQPDCLRTFEHSDFVTSVQFHPTDAQRFVSGEC